MKSVKHIGLILLLVCTTLFVVNCSSKQESSGNPSNEDKIDVTAKCEKIRKAWAQQRGWNDSLYHAQRNDIDQSNSMGLLSQGGLNAVNNALQESAANQTCEGYQNALHSTPVNDAELQRNYQGAKTLAEVEKMSNDSCVSHTMHLHELYNKIRTFVGADHAITAYFDTRLETWDSFAKLQHQVYLQARELRSNALYEELSHVPGFQEGLSEEKLKETTERSREAFYNSLSDQIVAHFNSKERTQTNYNLLYNIYKNFTNEEINYGAVNLAKCVAQWKIALEGN